MINESIQLIECSYTIVVLIQVQCGKSISCRKIAGPVKRQVGGRARDIKVATCRAWRLENAACSDQPLRLTEIIGRGRTQKYDLGFSCDDFLERIFAPRRALGIRPADDGVLAREIGFDLRLVIGVFLADANEAMFEDGGLVEQDVINHESNPLTGCRREYSNVPR